MWFEEIEESGDCYYLREMWLVGEKVAEEIDDAPVAVV